MRKILIFLVLCVGVNFLVDKYYSLDIIDEFGINSYVNKTALKGKIDEVILQAKYDAKYMTFGRPKYSDQDIASVKEYFFSLAENRQNVQLSPATQRDMDRLKNYVLSVVSKHKPSITDNIEAYKNRNL